MSHLLMFSCWSVLNTTYSNRYLWDIWSWEKEVSLSLSLSLSDFVTLVVCNIGGPRSFEYKLVPSLNLATRQWHLNVCSEAILSIVGVSILDYLCVYMYVCVYICSLGSFRTKLEKLSILNFYWKCHILHSILVRFSFAFMAWYVVCRE